MKILRKIWNKVVKTLPFINTGIGNGELSSVSLSFEEKQNLYDKLRKSGLPDTMLMDLDKYSLINMKSEQLQSMNSSDCTLTWVDNATGEQTVKQCVIGNGMNGPAYVNTRVFDVFGSEKSSGYASGYDRKTSGVAIKFSMPDPPPADMDNVMKYEAGRKRNSNITSDSGRYGGMGMNNMSLDNNSMIGGYSGTGGGSSNIRGNRAKTISYENDTSDSGAAQAMEMKILREKSDYYIEIVQQQATRIQELEKQLADALVYGNKGMT